MQFWNLTVEFKIWNIIYVLDNRIFSEVYMTELYMDHIELQVGKLLWYILFEILGWHCK
jgi:hypothetical protein